MIIQFYLDLLLFCRLIQHVLMQLLILQWNKQAIHNMIILKLLVILAVRVRLFADCQFGNMYQIALMKKEENLGHLEKTQKFDKTTTEQTLSDFYCCRYYQRDLCDIVLTCLFW